MLVGIDVGTSGLKAVAVDADTGDIVAAATRSYPLHTPRPGWAEQDGEDFSRAAVEALVEIAAEIGPRARRVAGIGLCGQMHTSMLLDAAGRPLRRAISWCDTRTTEACRAIERRVGRDRLAATVRNAALEGFTLPKLLWMRENEPEVLDRVRTVMMPKDFVLLELTGATGTEVSDASGTLAFDPARKEWSSEVLAAVGIDPALFPPVGESPDVGGRLRRELAERTGLPAGTPVARGAADNPAGAVGLGAVREGTGMASIGTSGVVLAPTRELSVDPELRLHSFCHAVPDRTYLMGVMLAAGGALEWYRDVLCGDERRRGAAGHRDPFDLITEGAQEASPGSRGVVFLPYLMGERTPHADPSARGAFVGITARTTKSDLSRAVLEGITFGLADSLALMAELDRPPRVGELRLTGGGARSAWWRQLVADVLGVETVTTSSTEGPAFGAAILGGVAAGRFGSVEEGADALVTVHERREPDPRTGEHLREAHGVYRRCYASLRDRFPELGRLDS